MKRIVVLTGAGVSAESGLKTFRDSNGLWRTYRFEEVASPYAWGRDPELVLEFYNIRRKLMCRLLLKMLMTCTKGPDQKTYCIFTGNSVNHKVLAMHL